MKMYECCNAECGWVGDKSKCVRFKHDTGYLMCPECNEVVEEGDEISVDEAIKQKCSRKNI